MRNDRRVKIARRWLIDSFKWIKKIIEIRNRRKSIRIKKNEYAKSGISFKWSRKQARAGCWSWTEKTVAIHFGPCQST